MKTKSSLPSLLVSVAIFVGTPLLVPQAFADHHETKPAGKVGTISKVTEKDAAWAAKARETYPLEACVVSDEKLGSMGKPAGYIYRVEGQPDRLVLFCCSGCEDDFMKAPAKHLAKIDAAKASKGKAGGDAKNTPKAQP